MGESEAQSEKTAQPETGFSLTYPVTLRGILKWTVGGFWFTCSFCRRPGLFFLLSSHLLLPSRANDHDHLHSVPARSAIAVLAVCGLSCSAASTSCEVGIERHSFTPLHGDRFVPDLCRRFVVAAWQFSANVARQSSGGEKGQKSQPGEGKKRKFKCYSR